MMSDISTSIQIFTEKHMRKFIERARQLKIQFDYGTSIRMAGLFDVGEALNAERTRLEELGFPTQVHDDLITKIQHEFLTEPARYNGGASLLNADAVSLAERRAVIMQQPINSSASERDLAQRTLVQDRFEELLAILRTTPSKRAKARLSDKARLKNTSLP